MHFYWKETSTQVFPCEYCEIFENSIFYRTPPVHYILLRFYVMIEFFWRLWVQNWHCSYFLCHYFVFLDNPVRISIPWLFCTCFYTKIFSNCNFRTYYNVGSSTILIGSLNFRINSKIAVNSPSNLLEHLRWLLFEFVFIWIIFCYYLEHVFVCLERYRITIVVLRILELPYPANKYSKSTTETLKQNVKSVKN